MKVGEKARLDITRYPRYVKSSSLRIILTDVGHSDFGYGGRGYGPIPGGADLIL